MKANTFVYVIDGNAGDMESCIVSRSRGDTLGGERGTGLGAEA